MRIYFNLIDENAIENIDSQQIADIKNRGWNIQSILDKDGFFLNNRFIKEGIKKEDAFVDIKEVFNVEPLNAVELTVE